MIEVRVKEGNTPAASGAAYERYGLCTIDTLELGERLAQTVDGNETVEEGVKP